MRYVKLFQALLAVERQGATHLLKVLPTYYVVFRLNQSATIEQPYQERCWLVAPWAISKTIPDNAISIKEVLA